MRTDSQRATHEVANSAHRFSRCADRCHTRRPIQWRVFGSIFTLALLVFGVAAADAVQGEAIANDAVEWVGPVRRNVASIPKTERDRLRDAIIELNKRKYPGSCDDPVPQPDGPVGGVSYWFKQDEIHQATHVHDGPAFLPWHRELCNRFESLLREVDPQVALHYWDWETNPRNLFTPDFMGNADDSAGEPWETAGFYDKDLPPGKARGESKDGNACAPPRDLTRRVGAGEPKDMAPGEWVKKHVGNWAWPSDEEILRAPTYADMRDLLERKHNSVHEYVGGTLGGGGHFAFQDPFVFLLHSNVDRLFALWQRAPYQRWRLRPGEVYGDESRSGSCESPNSCESPQALRGILTPLDPWAGNPRNVNAGLIRRIRPWAPPENEQEIKDSHHWSVVVPPPYECPPGMCDDPCALALCPITQPFCCVGIFGEPYCQEWIYAAGRCPFDPPVAVGPVSR